MENMHRDDISILQDIIYIFSGMILRETFFIYINSDLSTAGIYICILYEYTNMMLLSKDKLQKTRFVLHDCRILILNIHVQ